MIDRKRIAADLRSVVETLGGISFDADCIDTIREAMPVQTPRHPERLRIWDEYAEIGSVKIRIRFYEPADRRQGHPLPALCWYHGGGMALGSPESDESLCCRFAEEANCVVASVDYRRTPEYAYPVPFEDAFAGMEYVFANAVRLGILKERVAVGGASAGGNLCAAVCLRARDEEKYHICFAMPLFAMLDDSCDTISAKEFTEEELPFAWNSDVNRIAWEWYLKDVSSPPAYAVPARAEDLAGLPRTYMCVGELDPLRDENMTFAARLVASGVSTEFHLYSGAFHGFENTDSKTPLSIRAVDEYVSALRRAFWRGSAPEDKE